MSAVRESGKPPEQLVVISFHADTVEQAKRRLPELKAYYLASFKRDESRAEWTPGVEQLIEQAQRIGADGLDVSFEGPIDEEFVRRVRDARLELYVWTVDRVDVAQSLVRLGVAGMTTNRAQWLREALGQ